MELKNYGNVVIIATIFTIVNTIVRKLIRKTVPTLVEDTIHTFGYKDTVYRIVYTESGLPYYQPIVINDVIEKTYGSNKLLYITYTDLDTGIQYKDYYTNMTPLFYVHTSGNIYDVKIRTIGGRIYLVAVRPRQETYKEKLTYEEIRRFP